MISVGIDIGSFSVKLAEIQTSSKSYALTRFQEFPLSVDPSKDKKIETLDILRQIAGAYDPNQTKFILALNQQNVALRFRRFPFKERFKILRSIAFELEDDIPFSQDDAVFDAKITRYIENAADVIAGACPRSYIKDLVSLAQEAGIDPELVTVDGMALGNYLESWDGPPPTQAQLAPTPEPRPAEMIIDIGHLRTLVVVHSEGSLILARNIDWGGKNIADAIVAKYGIHYLEAIKELQKKAFILLSTEGATRDQIVFSDVIKQSFEMLAQEIKFTQLELATSRNLRFAKAHICGGVSQIKNLGPFLTQKWEVPVNRFRHLSLLPQVVLEPSPHAEAVSATAIAIALEGLRKARNPATNFMKAEFAHQGEALNAVWDKWGYTAKLLGTAFVILLIYGFARERFAVDLAEQGLQTLTDQAAVMSDDLKGRAATARKIRGFVQQKKAELNARKLAAQVKQVNSALDVLALVHQSAPGPKQLLVELRKVTIDNEEMVLHGEVATPEAVATFRQSLESVASDGRVDPVAPVITAGPGKQAFGFRLKVDRRGG